MIGKPEALEEGDVVVAEIPPELVAKVAEATMTLFWAEVRKLNERAETAASRNMAFVLRERDGKLLAVEVKKNLMARKYTCKDCGKKGPVESVQGPVPKRCPDCRKAVAAKAASDRRAGPAKRAATAPKGDAGELLGAAVRHVVHAEVVGCVREAVNECLLENGLQARIEAIVDARLRDAAEQIAKAARG